MEPVEITFELTGADADTYYDDFQTDVNLRTRSTQRKAWRYLYWIYIMGVPLLVFSSVNALFDNTWLSLGAMTLSVVIWQRVLHFLIRYRAVRKLKRTAGFLGKHRIVVNDRGMTFTSRRMEWTLFWRNMDDILVTKHFVLIRYSKEIGHGCYPIPLHAFPDESSRKAYVEYAANLWKQGAIVEAEM